MLLLSRRSYGAVYSFPFGALLRSDIHPCGGQPSFTVHGSLLPVICTSYCLHHSRYADYITFFLKMQYLYINLFKVKFFPLCKLPLLRLFCRSCNTALFLFYSLLRYIRFCRRRAGIPCFQDISRHPLLFLLPLF